ncbi:MAG: hypothetical protein ACRYFU_13060 [Janthinobacterium lividum]
MSEQNVVDAAPEFAGDASEGNFGSDFEGGADDDGGSGEQPGPGLGQSKSSRRRRRKRKKLVSSPGTVAVGTPEGGTEGESVSAGGGNGAVTSGGSGGYVPVVLEGESLALSAAAQTPAPFQSNGGQSSGGQRRPMGNGGQQGQNNGQGQGQGQAQGQGQGQAKRWKKKFRDRERRPGSEPRPENASNGAVGDRSANVGGDRHMERPPHRREGGRPDNFGNLVSHQGRKVKTGGGKERGFVGPMDHSYREVNPDLGEAPPSTIQLRGRRGQRPHSDNQPLDHNAPRAVPISEDAQTHIYLFIEDLFIVAKIQETARKLGVKVAFIKNEKEAITELTNGEEQNRPSLIVFDLNNANAKPLTLIPKLKTKLKRSASIIGFLSSVQGDLKAKAVEAGCDTVMPKAAFSQNLPNLLRRYGVEEAEEVNFNY